MTTKRELVLRTVPHMRDINANGHIFGGWVLSQMDIAGGIIAGREAQGSVATVAIESMQFIAPILIGDLISIYAGIYRRGRTWTPAITPRISAPDVIQRRRGEIADASIEPVFAFGAPGSAEPGRRSAGGIG